ncbi:hypothetical protein [Streptomyces sp. YU58]|uniref:hypothetical protein n=1 Tax=Streptomyces sp. SX92 TaxID=3158972 RepID=UPI0027B96CFF|nr:hypothetical protein [Streptomyces coralus]WLW51245.1 hypothetical protein QU709_07695 [Streptomyces coralus]
MAAMPGARQAPGELRRDLMSAGLSRRLPPRPTRAGRCALDALCAGRPLPRDRKGLSADGIASAVALHGEPALRVLAGRFALRAGLVARVEVAGSGVLRHSARSPYFCGAVSD